MLERATRIRVADPRSAGRFTFGSGFLVVAGRVLTAAHVLVAPDAESPAQVGDRCEVCWPEEGEHWVGGEVLWIRAEPDVALVRAGLGTGLNALPWGRLTGDEPIRWAAAGYPLASRDAVGGFRDREHVFGSASALSQSRSERLGLTVESRLANPSVRSSGWAGLSGAAVLCKERVVGVVTHDPAGYHGSLLANRLAGLAVDPGLLAALGGSVVLEDVSADTNSRLRSTLGGVGLPADLTDLIGRRVELATAAGELKRCRLLTVTGVGGVGKTRLAVAVARKVARRFPGGSWYADLGQVREMAATQAVASAVGAPEHSGSTLRESIVESLGDRQVLLVLDNCEHLIDAAREIASHLLARCPGLRIVATSRQPLELDGESLIVLDPLPVPDADATIEVLRRVDSVRLFTARAKQQAPGFTLDDDNAAAVAEICRWLEGIPLAIQLVVPRLRAFGALDVATDIRRWFASGRVDGVRDRQRTMYATLEWSHDLLSADERSVFERLGVFAGGFSVRAAEKVCATSLESVDIADVVWRLVLRSLVVRGAGGRLRLLEPVREYALEHLARSGATDELAGAHAAWASAFVSDAAAGTRNGDPRVLRAIDLEEANIREALRFLISDGRTEDGLRLAAQLGPYWFYRARFTEGRTWYETALADSSGASASTRASALIGLSELALPSDRPAALKAAGDAVRCSGDAGDPAVAASAMLALAHAERNIGRRDEALATYEKCIVAAREAGDRRLEILARSGISDVLARRGHFEEAIEVQLSTLAAAKDIGDYWEVTNATAVLGFFHNYAGRFDEGMRLLGEALAGFQSIASAWGTGWVRCAMAEVALVEGRVEAAEREYRAGLAEFEIGGMDELAAWAYSGLGYAALLRGEVPAARAHFTTMLAVRVRVYGALPEPEDFVPQMTALCAAEGRHALAARLLAAAAVARERGSFWVLYGKDLRAEERALATVRAALGDAFALNMDAGAASSMDVLVKELLAALGIDSSG